MAAMTTNERLAHVGIIDAWGEAVQQRDRAEMVRLLEQVTDSAQAGFIADATLSNSAKYGF